MKKLLVAFLFLVTVCAKGQSSSDLGRSIRVNGNVPGKYIRIGSNGKIGNVGVKDTSGHIEFISAVKIGKPSLPTSYTGIVNAATTPVPSAGAGTIVYTNGHFFGWIGTAWRQLDN